MRVHLTNWCPLTGNQPTKMTCHGFQHACSAKQEEQKHLYCDICQGEEWPKGLTIVDIKDFKEEERTMPACEQCQDGEDRKLYGSHGKQVCGTCQSIRGNVKNRSDIVVDVIREFHPELLNQGEPSQLHRDTIASLQEQLDDAHQRYTLLQDENTALQDEIGRVATSVSKPAPESPGPWKKFALGLINGSVSDVTAEDLRVLQGAIWPEQ